MLKVLPGPTALSPTKKSAGPGSESSASTNFQASARSSCGLRSKLPEGGESTSPPGGGAKAFGLGRGSPPRLGDRRSSGSGALSPRFTLPRISLAKRPPMGPRAGADPGGFKWPSGARRCASSEEPLGGSETAGEVLAEPNAEPCRPPRRDDSSPALAKCVGRVSPARVAPQSSVLDGEAPARPVGGPIGDGAVWALSVTKAPTAAIPPGATES
mmetsp:Transcript_50251/g.114046  ORF Transcript_50251/g.114046 Transcript_50251/m.114046 type:complete len:214 (+) Transcript_50251:488-1129(+)